MFDFAPMNWIDLGQAALKLAIPLELAVLGFLVAGLIYGDKGFVNSARRGFYIVAAALSVSILGLAVGFLSEACYDVKFITAHSDTSLEWFFQLAGVWAGQEGSILFWTWILSLYGAAMAFSLRKNAARKTPWVLLVFALIQMYFVAIVVLLEQNPFALFPANEIAAGIVPPDADLIVTAADVMRWLEGMRVAGGPNAPTYAEFLGPATAEMLKTIGNQPLPANLSVQAIAETVVKNAHAEGFSVLPDGRGLNPLLANYWIAIHPPCMYVGYIGASVLFAFALAALIVGEFDQWVKDVRRWLLFAWFFLTIGNVLGGLWAYEELGWGGFWDWDPVENAAFVPWLTATAMLHTAAAQDARGGFRVWNLTLAALTFILTIWGTWVTRSGAIDSVHAFADGTVIGAVLLGAVGIVIAGTTWLIVHRWPEIRGVRTSPDTGKPIATAARPIGSLWTREAMILGGAILLLIILAMVVALTLWPLLTWRTTGDKAATREVFFITTPFFVLMFLAMGAGVGLTWRRQTGQLATRLKRPALVGLAVAAITGIVQFQFSSLSWQPLVENIQLGVWNNDTLRALVLPLIPPMVWGTAVFGLLTVFLEFHVPALKRARKGDAHGAIVADAAAAPAASYAPAGGDSKADTEAESRTDTSVPATKSDAESDAKPDAGGFSLGRYLGTYGRLIAANRRRYGGYIVHVGATLVLLGICAATMFKTEAEIRDWPLGSAYTVNAGFPTRGEFTYTLRRYEVGMRLAIDREELQARLKGESGESGGTATIAAHAGATVPMEIRDGKDFVGGDDVVQIMRDGDLPLAYFEVAGALGEAGQYADGLLDALAERTMNARPGPAAARMYFPANYRELVRLDRAGDLGTVLTYFYGRSWLELRIDAPALTLDLSPLLVDGAESAELVVETEAGTRTIPLVAKRPSELPELAFNRLAGTLLFHLQPWSVSLNPNRAAGIVRLIPTGAVRTLSRPSAVAQSPEGFLRLAVTRGPAKVVGDSQVSVVPPTQRFAPEIRQYVKGSQQVTREAAIAPRFAGDDFVVPIDYLQPATTDPNAPGMTAFTIHQIPGMTVGLIGVGILVVGTLICFWPGKRRETSSANSVESGSVANSASSGDIQE